MKGLGRAALAALVVAACSPAPGPSGPLETGSTVLGIPPASVPSPDGSMTLIYSGEEEQTLTLSAGFLRRSPVGRIEVPSRLSWSPDSRRFFVNDSGSASWSTFRLWSVSARAQAVESAVIHQAAIAELGRLNGCAQVPAPDATTRGMGWADGGKRVLVLAEVRRTTGDCAWGKADYVLLVADPSDGKILETHVEGDARRRYPTLEWTPVTEP